MTLYETIYARRQVREFLNTPLEQKLENEILHFAREAEQLEGQCVTLKMVPASQVSNSQGAPCCLLAYCEPHAAAYANVGFVLQKADLYIQSIGLGCGWFMSIKPKENKVFPD